MINNSSTRAHARRLSTRTKESERVCVSVGEHSALKRAQVNACVQLSMQSSLMKAHSRAHAKRAHSERVLERESLRDTHTHMHKCGFFFLIESVSVESQVTVAKESNSNNNNYRNSNNNRGSKGTQIILPVTNYAKGAT